MPARGTTPPDVGVEFELTIDGDATDPFGMVRNDGYDPEGWEHKGSRVTGRQARRFKLVQVGRQPNLEAVRRALALYGDIPEGQWREAFKAAYPTPDCKGPIGVADPSWVLPDGSRDFPYLSDGFSRWLSDFFWTAGRYVDGWRWLVACK